MKKFLAIAAGAAVFAITPSLATAQSTASTISGTVAFRNGSGWNLYCNATIGLDGSTPATSSNVTSIVFSGGSFTLCQFIEFPNVPHAISQSGGNFNILDVYIDPLFGPRDCQGDITGTISDGVVTINAEVPEVEAGSGSCRIAGVVS